MKTMLNNIAYNVNWKIKLCVEHSTTIKNDMRASLKKWLPHARSNCKSVSASYELLKYCDCDKDTDNEAYLIKKIALPNIMSLGELLKILMHKWY